jgi:diguanylate cyclase (GGDEF)-like protein
MGDDHARAAVDHDEGGEATRAGDDRDRTAEHRDRSAERRDRTAEARDRRAESRDRRADAREQAADGVDVVAASDRAGASRDRRASTSDRAQATADRKAGAKDRAMSARDRAVASIDELTGAHSRAAGVVELEREIARASRTKRPCVLAFIDVDDLKAINDSQGHAGGDRLLRQIGESLRAHLRSYDLMVRYGGDEFVCALAGLSMAQAANRFMLVNADLAGKRASITAGLAELKEGDSLEDLIERADEALYRERQQRTA